MRRTAIALLSLALLVKPAAADGELDKILTAEDKQRLAKFDQTKADALAEARAGGSAADIAALDAALKGTPLSLRENFDIKGDWRCRTIKLGGLLPLVAYPWFKCRIGEDRVGYVLSKRTGSQRTTGHFYDSSDTRLVYVGAGHVDGEKPRNYGDDAEQNQVAHVERLGAKKLVLQFPAPKFESKFDLLVLERR